MLPAASAATVTLGWSPNDEPDLEGYVVYRNPEKPGPPYKYSDTLPEDDLADPLHPKLKLTGLKKDSTYHIALTAYDTEGNESNFSREVCVQVVNDIVELCSESVSPGTGSSSSSGGGGGGGGGCFISTVEYESSTSVQFAARPVIRSRISALFLLLLVLIAAVKLGFNKANQTN
jgi:hypothetical protein